jgi:hypothetical protein
MKSNRITPEIKLIANAHIKAKITGKFDDPVVNNKAELIKALHEGKTFSQLLDTIEIRFCSIGTLLLASGTILDQHISNNYRSGIYKGFKTLLNS